MKIGGVLVAIWYVGVFVAKPRGLIVLGGKVRADRDPNRIAEENKRRVSYAAFRLLCAGEDGS